MARMHSRKKGKAKSHKPLQKTKPTWIRYTAKEIELLIGKLAKEGKNASEIGLILRDSYGIPDVKLLTNKKITKILKEKNLAPELPEDLKALIKKAILVRKHLELNKHDKTAKRGVQLTESKIKRLVKYYKESGKLPEEWKYDPASVKIYAE
ncbi:30S ribosomal protein S15 [Candidatus Woesearchaeota archaeon ex4484_78]|nr:MAG: 30S ribosomal protein S15 [Candidatus Woesearchaeota archaeon ex4484_78]